MERMSIYRMRPMNDRTLEELSEPYLWFSRRCGFKDKKDANVAAIIDKNEELMKVFYEKYGKDQTDILKKALDCTGICCFTKELPTKINWCKFPHAKEKLICVEYDTDILQNYFNSGTYALGECFKDVEYCDDSTLLNLIDAQDVKIMPNGDKLLTPLKTIFYDAKDADSFISKLLTRIDNKHRKQNECRIILGGRNIPSFSQSIDGYKIPIPKESILRIHLYNDECEKTKEYCEELSKLSAKYEISWR